MDGIRSRWARHRGFEIAGVAIALVLVPAIGSFGAVPRGGDDRGLTDRSAHQLSLLVAVHNYQQVPNTRLIDAEVEAARIFGSIGVDIQWLDIGQLAEQQAAASLAGHSRRIFTVHLGVLSSTAAHGSVRGGTGILGGAAPNSGWAYVFWDLLRGFLRREHLEYPERFFGHVMAHEIGHVLLSDNSHSLAGVMKARLDRRRVVDQTLQFSDAEAVRIRTRLQQENGVTPWRASDTN